MSPGPDPAVVAGVVVDTVLIAFLLIAGVSLITLGVAQLVDRRRKRRELARLEELYSSPAREPRRP